MSQSFAVGSAAQPVGGAPRAGEQGRLAELDLRRKLQLALAVIWLLDGILQYQPSMFSKAFPQMLAGSSAGNPAAIASPINWSATLITHHLVALNAIFATIQVALGLGIAWRPTVKLALGASVTWALAVWWLGEGLGGVLAGKASPVNGAPGAVLLYGLVAVLLWPADRDPAAPFTAGRAVGRRVARACWLVVWLGLAVLALLPASRAIGGTIADASAGEPAWLAWIDAHAASALARHGLLAAIVLAAVFVVVALAPLAPPRAGRADQQRVARAVIILAITVAAALWLAQGLGGILTGS